MKVFALLLLAASSVMGAVDVVFPLQDFTASAYANRVVTITPLSTPGTNATSIIVSAPISTNSGTTGQFTVPTMAPGSYRVTVAGQPTITSFQITFTNDSGTINAKDYLSTNIIAGASVAYTQTQSDSRYVRAATNGPLISPTNFFYAGLTNGSNVSITRLAGGVLQFSATNSGGSSFATNTILSNLAFRGSVDSLGLGAVAHPLYFTNAAFDGIFRTVGQTNVWGLGTRNTTNVAFDLNTTAFYATNRFFGPAVFTNNALTLGTTNALEAITKSNAALIFNGYYSAPFWSDGENKLGTLYFSGEDRVGNFRAGTNGGFWFKEGFDGDAAGGILTLAHSGATGNSGARIGGGYGSVDSVRLTITSPDTNAVHLQLDAAQPFIGTPVDGMLNYEGGILYSWATNASDITQTVNGYFVPYAFTSAASGWAGFDSDQRLQTYNLNAGNLDGILRIVGSPLTPGGTLYVDVTNQQLRSLALTNRLYLANLTVTNTPLIGGGTAGQILTATSGGSAWSNAPSGFTNLPSNGTTNYGVIVGGVALSGVTNFNSVSGTNGYFTNIFATNLVNVTNITYNEITATNPESAVRIWARDDQNNTNGQSFVLQALYGSAGTYTNAIAFTRYGGISAGSNIINQAGAMTLQSQSGIAGKSHISMNGNFFYGHNSLATLAVDHFFGAPIDNSAQHNGMLEFAASSGQRYFIGFTAKGNLRGTVQSNSINMVAGFNSTNVVATSNATTTYTVDLSVGQNFKFTNSVNNAVYWITNWNDGNRFTVSILNTGGATYWFSNASAGPLYPNSNSLAFVSDGAVHEFFSVGTNVYATKSSTNFSGRSF